MSDYGGQVVDSKVVEMSFENDNFESNANQSISTLDRLKKALNFSNSTKGLDEINNSIENVKVNPLIGGINTLHSAIDNLSSTVGFVAIVRYANQALDAVERLTKTLTTANVSAGWQKYADKTTSVATLTAQGYDIDTVTDQLERLNWFTDETSYNFVDMVGNIGKFTAAGQGLEDSVTAMEGIANWAALSGQNASKASQAMYQLSQAMGAGVMRKEDYKSIQNVSMDTVEFRQHALDAAVALGTLKKTGEDTYKSLVAGKKEFTIDQFADHLTQDAWFTSDVMMAVFKDYSNAVDQIYEYADEKGITASEAMEQMGSTLDEFGLKAFKSAQQARTLQDAIDSIQDAASTTWMNIFETIFGNAEDATDLWTTVANEGYDIFVGPLNSLQEIVEDAFGGDTPSLTKDMWKNLGLTAEQSGALAKSLMSVAESEGKSFESKSVDDFIDSLDTGWLTVDKLNQALNGPEGTGKSLDEIKQKALEVIKGNYGNDMAERFRLLNEEGFDAQQVQDYVNTLRELTNGTWEFNDAIFEEANASFNAAEKYAQLTDEQLASEGWTPGQIQALRQLQKQAEETGTPLNELVKTLSTPEKTGRETFFESVGRTLHGVGKIFDQVKIAFGSVFNIDGAGALKGFISGFEKLSLSVKDFTNHNSLKFRAVFQGIFSVLDLGIRIITNFASTIKSVLGKAFDGAGQKLLMFGAKVGKGLSTFRDWVVQNEFIEKAFTHLGNVLDTGVDKVKSWFSSFLELPIIAGTLSDFKNAFGSAIEYIGKNFATSGETVKTFIDTLKTNIKGVASGDISFADAFKNITNGLKTAVRGLIGDDAYTAFATAFGNLKDRIGGLFGSIGDTIWDWLSGLRSKFEGTKFGDILGGLMDGFTDAKESIKQIFTENGDDGIIGIITKSFEKIKNVISKSSIGSIFTGIFDTIKESGFSLETVFTLLGKGIGNIINLITQIPWGKVLALGGVILVISKVVSVFKKLASLATAPFSLMNSLSDFFSQLTTGGLKSIIFGQGKSAIEKLASSVRSIAISIAILVGAIAILAGMETGDLKKALVVIAVLSGIITAMMGLTKLMGSKLNGKVDGLGFVAMASSLLIMAVALEKISGIKTSKLANAEIALGVLAGIITAMMAVQKIIGHKFSGDKTNVLSYVAMAGSLLIMAMALEKIANIKTNKLVNAEIALGVLAGIITAMMAVQKVFSSTFGSGSINALGFVAAAGALYIMAMAVAKLSDISVGDLAKATIAIGALAGIVTLMMVAINAMGSVGPSMLTVIPTILAIGVVIGAMCAALGYLTSLDTNNLATAAKSFTEVIAAISLLMGALTLAGSFGPAALIGAAEFGAIFAAVAAIITGLGAIAELLPPGLISKLEDFYNSGVEVLCNVANGMGRIVGAFVGGIASQAASSAPEIAQSVTEFIHTMAGLSDVDAINMQPLQDAVDALLMFSWAGFADSLASIVSGLLLGKSAVQTAADDIVSLSEAMVIFSDNLKGFQGIDDDAKTHFMEALQAAKTAISSVTVTGIFSSIGAIFTNGERSAVQTFSKDISDLSAAMITFSDNLASFTPVTDEAAATFIAQLEIAKSAIKSVVVTGIFSSIGKLFTDSERSAVETFSSDVIDLSTSMSSFADTLSTFTPVTQEQIDQFSAQVQATSTSIRSAVLTGVFSSIGNLFTDGEKTALEQFSSDVTDLTTSMSTFADSLVTFTPVSDEQIQQFTQQVNAAATSIQAAVLTGVFSSIGDLFSDDERSAIGTFSSDVTDLTESMNTFSTNLAGFTPVDQTTVDEFITQVNNAASAIDSATVSGIFSAIGDLFTDDEKSAVATFSSDIVALSDAMITFSTDLGNFTPVDEATVTTFKEQVSLAASAISSATITGIFSAIGDLFTDDEKSAVQQFSTDIGDLSEAMTTFSTDLASFTPVDQETVTAFMEQVNAAATAIQSAVITGIFSTIGDLFTDDEKSAIGQFSTDIGDLSEAMTTFAGDLTAFTPVDEDTVATFNAAVKSAATAIQGAVVTGTFSAIGDLFTDDEKSAVQQFSTDIGDLSEAMTTFSGDLAGFTPVTEEEVTAFQDAVNAAETAISSVTVTGLVSAMGNIFTGAITGNTDPKSAVEQFSTDIGSLADALTAWNDKMGSFVGENSFEVPDFQGIVDAMKKLPNEGGLLSVMGSLFTGDKVDLDKFKEDVGKLGDALNEFVTKLGDVNIDALDTATESLKKVVEAADTLGSSYYEGSELGTLGAELPAFGEQIAKFIEKIPSPDEWSQAASGIESLVTTTKTAAEIDLSGSDIMNAETITAFTTNLDTLFQSLSGIAPTDTTGIDAIAAAIEKLNGITIPKDAFATEGSKTNAKSAGEELAGAIGEGIKTAVDKISTAITTALTGATDKSKGESSGKFKALGEALDGFIADGVNSKGTMVVKAVKDVSDRAGRAVKMARPGFYAAGAYLCEGLAAGIKDNGGIVTQAAIAMAKECLAGMKGALQEQSPSKATKEMGYFLDAGLANGIRDNVGLVTVQAMNLGDRAVAAVEGSIEKLGRVKDTLGKGVSDATDELKLRVITKIKSITDEAGGTANKETLKQVSKVVNSLKEKVQEAKTSDLKLSPEIDTAELESGAASAEATVDEVKNKTDTSLEQALAKLRKVRSLLKSEIEGSATEMSDGTKKAVAGSLDISTSETENKYGRVIGRLKNFVTGGVDDIGRTADEEALKKVNKTIKMLETEVGSGAEKVGKKLKDNTKTAIGETGEVAETETEKTTNSMADGIDKGSDKVVDASAKVAKAGAKAAADEAIEFEKAGKDLAEGLAKGIDSGTKKVTNASGSIGEKMAAEIREILKIHSPSKVTEEIGEFFDLGLAKGIWNKGTEVTRSTAHVGRLALESIQHTVNLISQVANDEIDITPTVRPVVDLSDIKRNGNRISDYLNLSPTVTIEDSLGKISQISDARRNDTTNSDLLYALRELKDTVNTTPSNTYNINGITYDDGSNVAAAVGSLIRAARIERRA